MTQKESGENEEISSESDEKTKLLFSTIIGKHTKQGAKSVSPTMMSGIISDAFCCFGTDLAVKFNSLHDFALILFLFVKNNLAQLKHSILMLKII